MNRKKKRNEPMPTDPVEAHRAAIRKVFGLRHVADNDWCHESCLFWRERLWEEAPAEFHFTFGRVLLDLFERQADGSFDTTNLDALIRFLDPTPSACKRPWSIEAPEIAVKDVEQRIRERWAEILAGAARDYHVTDKQAGVVLESLRMIRNWPLDRTDFGWDTLQTAFVYWHIRVAPGQPVPLDEFSEANR